MTKIRRVDFYPDDFIAGTVALSLVERGLFWTACAMIYSHGGPIEEADLRRLCPSHGRTFRIALDRLLALGKVLRQSDGKLDAKRCQSELKRAANRVANAYQNGSKGGRPSNEINAVAKPDGFEVSRARAPGRQQPSKQQLDILESSRDLGRCAPAREGAHEGTGPADAGSPVEPETGTRDAPWRDAEDNPVVLDDAERGERVKRIDELLAKLTGGTPAAAAVRDPVAYERAVRDTKRDAWLRALHAWASERLAGDDRMRAWEAINAGMTAGSRDATPKDARRLIDQLDRFHKAEQLRVGRIALGLETALAAE